MDASNSTLMTFSNDLIGGNAFQVKGSEGL